MPVLMRNRERDYLASLRPNETISPAVLRLVVAVQAVCVFALWTLYPSSPLVPKPWEILQAFPQLWREGLGYELWVSLGVNAQALAITAILALGLAYLTVIPAMRPLVALISKMRFLGFAGLTFFFTMMVYNGRQLKVSLLVFGMVVFFVTSMVDEVASIPRERFDDARTLRMGEWRATWEVVVLGKIDQAFDVFRQNAAMGFMLLTLVEVLVRSEGGIGALLAVQDRQFRLAQVLAIQLTILLVGMGQDYVIGLAKRIACPYASLGLERR